MRWSGLTARTATIRSPHSRNSESPATQLLFPKILWFWQIPAGAVSPRSAAWRRGLMFP